MLDDLAIHIGDIKRAIRSVGQLNRAEPEIGRSKEFDFLFVRRPFSHEGDAVRTNFLPMNQITTAIGNKSIAKILAGPGVSAEDSDAGGGSEIAGSAAPALNQTGNDSRYAPFGANDAPLFLGADAID